MEKDTWQEEGHRVGACLFCASIPGVTPLGNHTPSSTHRGTSVKPVIFFLFFAPQPPPSSALLNVEIGQPHIMEGQ